MVTGQEKIICNKAIIKITHIINTSFRIKYIRRILENCRGTSIPKLGKPLNKVDLYRPISLLPTELKLFEKLLFISILTPAKTNNNKNLIPSHQFDPQTGSYNKLKL